MPNSVVVFVVLHVAAGLQVERTQSRPNAPSPECTTTVNSAQFFDPSLQASQAPDPVLSTDSCTRTFLQRRSCGRTRKGEQPQKKESPETLPGTLARTPAPPRSAEPPRAPRSPAGRAELPVPRPPRPSDLAVHRDGVGGDDECLLAALGIVLLGLLLGQSRVERHLHHSAAWGALGGRRRARGEGWGLLASAAASSAGSGSATTEVKREAPRLLRRLLLQRSRSLTAPGRGRRRLAPPGAGLEPGGRRGGTAGGRGGAGRRARFCPRPKSHAGSCRLAGSGDRRSLGVGLDFPVLSSFTPSLPPGSMLQVCNEVRWTLLGSPRTVASPQAVAGRPFPARCPHRTSKDWKFWASTPPFPLYFMELAQWRAEMFNTLYPCDLTTFIFLGPHPRALPDSDLPCLHPLPWKVNTYPA